MNLLTLLQIEWSSVVELLYPSSSFWIPKGYNSFIDPLVASGPNSMSSSP